MRAKRFTVEQIVAKLREAEKLQAQGMTIPQLCKRLQISDQTFYRWRIKYGALKEDEAQRLKVLEQENSRLKRIVADQALDIAMLKDLQRGKYGMEPSGTGGARARRAFHVQLDSRAHDRAVRLQDRPRRALGESRPRPIHPPGRVSSSRIDKCYRMW